MSDAQSFLWGQSARMRLEFGTAVSQQVLQVSLPSPAVCAIYLRVEQETPPGFGNIHLFTAQFTIGLGRTNIRRTLVWPNAPAPGAPIEFVIPMQPVGALQLDCTLEGVALPEIFVNVGAELAPITHISPSAKPPLKFGMALPGEAEGVDDDAFDELEEYDPDLVEQLRQMRESGEEMPSMEAIADAVARKEGLRERGPSRARRTHDTADTNARAVRRFSRRRFR
jgi:hypothetical protein